MVERLKHVGTSHSSSDLLKIFVKMGASWSAQVFRQAGDRPVAIVDISTYRTIYGYERDHFWCRDILRLIIFL